MKFLISSTLLILKEMKSYGTLPKVWIQKIGHLPIGTNRLNSLMIVLFLKLAYLLVHLER